MKALLLMVGLVIAGVAVASVGAVGVMLGSGVLHGYFEQVPAFSFWQSYAIAWGVQSLQRIRLGNHDS